MTYCCGPMRGHCDYLCPQHGLDCPDRVITRTPKGYYVLPVRDGGSSGIKIKHCPWCGTRLDRIVDLDQPGARGVEHRAVENTIAGFEQLLAEDDVPSPRIIEFAGLLMNGKPLTAGGSWLLTESHGAQVTSMIALNTREAEDLRDQMIKRLS